MYYALFLAVCLLSQPAAIQPKQTSHPVPTSDAVESIKTLLGSLVEGVQIKDGALQVVAQDAKGLRLNGTATIYNVENVLLSADMGTDKITINALFPAGAGRQIKFGGQSVYDWVPSFLQSDLDISRIDIEAYPKQNNRTLASATLSQITRSEALSFQGMSLLNPQLKLGIEMTGSATQANASLGGTLQLGSIPFDLEAYANTRKEWEFSAHIEALSLNELLLNSSKLLSLPTPALPSFFQRLQARSIEMKVQTGASISLSGESELGKLEINLDNGTPKSMILGLAPNTGFKLANVHSSLQPLDQMGLSDLVFVYASQSARLDQELSLSARLSAEGIPLGAGLNLLAGFELPANLPGMKQKGNVVIRTLIPTNISATPSLRASVLFNGLQLGQDFEIRESFIQIAPVDMAFSTGLSLAAKLDGNWIAFSGMGEIAPPATLGLVVFMEQGSVWKNPFGVKGVAISDLGLDLGADVLSPIPRPKLGVSGALKIGPFQGQGAGMLDTGNPLNSLISLKMNRMALQQFIDAFSGTQVKSELNKLPAQLRDIGVENAQLTIIPKTTEMAGRTYEQGLRIKGTATIAGLGARLDLLGAYDSGIKGDAAIVPILIKEGDLLIFQLSGNAAQDSARMAADLTLKNVLNPQNPIYLVDAKIGLLGMSAQTKAEIGRNGVYFFSKGNLFGKFFAEFDVKGGSFGDVKGMNVRASMKNDLIAYLNKEATGEIDRATKNSQNAYRQAKQDLERAKQDLAAKQAALDNAIRIKNEKDAALARAWDQVPKEVCKRVNFGVTKKTFCIPIPTRSIPSEVCQKFSVIGRLCIPLPNHENLRKLIGSAEKAARDAAAEVTSSQTSRDIARGVLDQSQKAVDVFDKASTGSLKAAKWIVDKGLGGVVDVKSAEFAGKLDVLKGGQVNMKINTKFLDNSYNSGLTFNFNSPADAAKALANLLMNDQGAKGFAPEMGPQIGQRY